MKDEFDTSAFVITSDCQYIPAGEYDGGGEGVFVMLTNDVLNQEYGDDNSILIHRDWIDAVSVAKKKMAKDVRFKRGDRYASCPWQKFGENIPGTFKLNSSTDEVPPVYSMEREKWCIKYLDGYKSTHEIINNVTETSKGLWTIDEYIPAIMTAHRTEVSFGGRILHGYLPAIGQLVFIDHNITLINDTLERIGRRTARFEIESEQDLVYLKGSWWSAMEFDDYLAWFRKSGHCTTLGKTQDHSVLPLFII